MAKIWLPKNVRNALKGEKMAKLMLYSKKHLKKCVVCGKEELMASRQKQCHDCYVKSNKPNTCVICGRHSTSFFGRKNELNICSFCLKRMRREREAKKYASRFKRCTSCGSRIWDYTALKYNGLCQNCFEITEMLKEAKEKVVITQ